MPGIVPGGPGTSRPPPTGSGGVWDWLPGVSELQSVKVLIGEISDWHMWASVGWIALGAVLLFMGLRMWAGKPALPSAPSVVPVPV